MANKNNRFQRGVLAASGCYTCRCCGKKTRETGHDESSVELCAFCYLEAGMENQLADGVCTEIEFLRYMLAQEAKYGRRSTNPIVVEFHKVNTPAPKSYNVGEHSITQNVSDQVEFLRSLGIE